MANFLVYRVTREPSRCEHGRLKLVPNTLIVDDEGDIRLLLQLAIDGADHGLRVAAQASTGEEALEIHSDVDVDVVVLDNRMPGLTGIETATALLEQDPGLPIVLYSAHLDHDTRAAADRAGIRACISKGNIAELVATLRDLTGLPIVPPREWR